MSEIKVTSEIQKINCPIKDVYALLSDFKRLGIIVNMAKSMGQIPAIPELADKIEDVQFDQDTCTLIMKGGTPMTINIVEREDPKMIKMCTGPESPMGFILWIQLLEKDSYDTRLRLTFNGELNFAMKLMLKGKMEKGINQLAEGLTKIPYSMLANM